ncbi:MAG: hypothetical protein HY904_03100 [Deltaproteobacteria bacterium]|nr:hypothetical protein [Deltaproteobacteria bacterium]
MNDDTMLMKPLQVGLEPGPPVRTATTTFVRAEPGHLVHWQSLWVSLVDHHWATLAVVPVGPWPRGSEVTGRLVDAARSMCQAAFSVEDPSNVPDEVGRAILPLTSPLLAPASALVARNVDAALLVVSLGRDTLSNARAVRDLIGPEKFVGCLVVREGDLEREPWESR